MGLIYSRVAFEITWVCFKAPNSLVGTESFTKMFMWEEEMSNTLHLLQIKVFLPWCRETTCPDVFTAAFLQTGDRDLRAGGLPVSPQICDNDSLKQIHVWKEESVQNITLIPPQHL